MTALPIPAGIDQSTPEYAEKVAQLNDLFRQTGRGGKSYVTPAILALGPAAVILLQRAVATHTTFTEDNDPYGWREIGVIERPDLPKVFWKIDYYDPDFNIGSEDPADPTKTGRLLTILLASEY
ncbi:DUF3768 domain-containing protein [Elstera sp.]|uniref:DUF3768 domain-containing protein n=1 Tax=Elstera sp. TaxID=1916664 RepID=UPI0037C19005